VLGPSETANLNHWTKSRDPVILSVIYHRKNRFDYAITALTKTLILTPNLNTHFVSFLRYASMLPYLMCELNGLIVIYIKVGHC
jgi:hypothetical protein